MAWCILLAFGKLLISCWYIMPPSIASMFHGICRYKITRRKSKVIRCIMCFLLNRLQLMERIEKLEEYIRFVYSGSYSVKTVWKIKSNLLTSTGNSYSSLTVVSLAEHCKKVCKLSQPILWLQKISTEYKQFCEKNPFALAL